MTLPATLLLTYKEEYEATSITIEELCNKYDITPTQLLKHKTWKKQEQQAPIKLPETPTIKGEVLLDVEDKNISEKEEVLTKIGKFKKLAMSHALDFMENNAQYAEIKEFKDLVGVVDSIEKSYQKTQSEPQINIIIQNLQQRFRETLDDC